MMDFLTLFGMWGIGLLTGFALARHRQDRLERECELTPDQVAYCREKAEERRKAWTAHAANTSGVREGKS